jgi:4'-phosphopantetheinyl transferase EntD
VAIAVKSNVLKSIGIDVHDYLRPDINWGEIKFIFLTQQELLFNKSSPYDRLDIIYSCKESIIKCLSPILLQYIDPRKITIKLDLEKNTFQAETTYIQNLFVHGFFYLTNRFIVSLAYVQENKS